MRLTLRNALRLASVPVGAGVGLWTAGMSVTIRPPSSSSCAAFWLCSPGPRFALWQCALFGCGCSHRNTAHVSRDKRDECPSHGVGAGGSADWSVDGVPQERSRLPLPELLPEPGRTPGVLPVALRLVRRGRGGCPAPSIVCGGRTVEGTTAQG